MLQLRHTPHIPFSQTAAARGVRAAIAAPVMLASCLLTAPACAQTSFPMIWSVYPAGVERGKTTTVTVYTGGSAGGGGGNLYGAYAALFEGKGVTAEIMPPDKGWPARDPKKPNETAVVADVRMKVTAAADASPGIREFRIGTPRFGISTVGQLVIGDRPEVLQADGNKDSDHAQTVAAECVVNGRLAAPNRTDFYKINVGAGQELTFAVLCARLEDKIHDLDTHADPLLTITDSQGAVLAVQDDFYGADPLLHYRFEKAGAYLVQIRDVTYHGNAQWIYRLTITGRPYVLAALPCAVQPGAHARCRLAGFNLGSAAEAEVDVPADAPHGLWSTQFKLPGGGLSNPVPLLVTDAPQSTPPDPAAASGVRTAAASGAADAIRGALALPGGVSSWLAQHGEIDRYRFSVKKGEAWGFEVTARRLDSQMDSELKLRDARGSVIAENDDAIGKDSRIDWTAPETGSYTVEVRDIAGQYGPTYFYNLAAERLRPDFALRCDPDRAMIAPGNRTAWYIHLTRKYGFDGPVKVDVTGLPAGVTATPLTLPQGMDQGVVVLAASADAKQATSLVEVTGSAALPGADGKPAQAARRAEPLEEIYIPGGGRGQLPADTQGVSVTEPNDLEVAVSTDRVSLKPGGSAKIEVTLKRRPDYTKPVTLDVMVQHLGQVFSNPLPPGVSIDDGASKTLLGDNETKGYITLKAAGDAHPITDWPIAVLANASINFVMKVWYSSPVVQLSVGK